MVKPVTIHGRIKYQYVKGGSNFSVSTTNHRITVPNGRKWIVQGGIVNRDVSAAVTVRIYNAADELLHNLLDVGAGTGVSYYPQNLKKDIMLDEGWYIVFAFTVAQGATAEISLTYLENAR